MPELPEIETICRHLRPVLTHSRIEEVQVFDDTIVFRSIAPEKISSALTGSTISEIGRKGKFFWLRLEDDGALMAHLGMSGWAELIDEHRPFPKYLKLLLTTDGGARVAFTDARRLGRIWLADDPFVDKQVKALGFDCLNELPNAESLAKAIQTRKAPIKGILLDQSAFAGIGNYLADEVLYQARIAPARAGSDLSKAEISKLRAAIKSIVGKAVDAEADESQFPSDWLFHRRWGGKRGAEKIGRYLIRREEIAGRTTAWVPGLQK
jgi:formamidopyrimidine-DNA glycosylase